MGGCGKHLVMIHCAGQELCLPTGESGGKHQPAPLIYQVAARASIYVGDVLSKYENHSEYSRIGNYQHSVAASSHDPSGISHFDGECRTCFSSYWQSPHVCKPPGSVRL